MNVFSRIIFIRFSFFIVAFIFRFPCLFSLYPTLFNCFAHNYRFAAASSVVFLVLLRLQLLLLLPLLFPHARTHTHIFSYCLFYLMYYVLLCISDQHLENWKFNQWTFSLTRSLNLWLIRSPFSFPIQVLIINIQYTCLNRKIFQHADSDFTCRFYCLNALHVTVCVHRMISQREQKKAQNKIRSVETDMCLTKTLIAISSMQCCIALKDCCI